MNGEGAGERVGGDAALPIGGDLAIPLAELSFETSRSSGPGGQNVNKVESRVTLRFPLASSPSLDERQRELLLRRLRTRVSKAGVLRVSAQRHRSQAANREEAMARFAELLRDALAEDPERRPTRPTPASRRRRLQGKRRRGNIKRLRSAPPD
jgi:ribosome-associated protein